MKILVSVVIGVTTVAVLSVVSFGFWIWAFLE